MNYHEIAPNLPLSRFINKAWFLSHSPPHRQEKILPLPVHHFIINLSDEPYRVVWQGGRVRSWTFAGGFVSGIQSSYLIIENPARILHVGVELTPYGLAAFTSAAPDSYSNTVQPSEHLLVGSHALASQLKRMASPETQLQKLLEFMAAKLRPEFALQAYLEPSLGLLATTPSVAEVARTAGVSHKQLASQWKRYAGITPKQYQNIVRLQQVVAWFEQAEKPPKWGRLVSELPYTDQPYFIAKFRELTGFSPREYATTLARYPSGEQSFVALDAAYAG